MASVSSYMSSRSYPRESEDSTFRKVCSCLPFIGPFIGFSQIYSLNAKIRVSIPFRTIDLLNLKNEYYAANIIHCIGMVALECVAAALGIVTIGYAAFWSAAWMICVGLDAYDIHQCENAIRILDPNQD